MSKKTRYIKPKIIEALNNRHFFECAWCGVKLTERHHIYEFSKGGGNTEENLILLCSTCHTEVHMKNSNIQTSDLLNRKSTHLKGDRISGNLQFEIEKNKIRLGSTFFENCETIITYADTERILFLEKFNNVFYLSTRFYNKNGDLVFWMSKNRYWAYSTFTITSSAKKLTIKNFINKNYQLKIWQNENEDYININGIYYRNGSAVIINSERLIIGDENKNQITIIGSGTIVGKSIINL